jgi:hypothetical protein
MCKKRRKGKKEKWKDHPRNGGYDAKEAKCVLKEFDQIKSGTDL